jgi:glycosyltransferase involved in cell wall biosynthesis
MKVAVSIPLYPTPEPEPGTRIGSWISTHECLIALARAGHQVDVVPWMVERRREYVLDGVRVHAGYSFPRFAGHAHLLLSHTGGVRRNPAQEPHPDRAVTQARRLHRPVVRMAHGTTSTWHETEGDLIVFNGRALLDEAYAGGWTGPSIIIPPPIWASAYATIPGDAVTCINLSPEKGVHIFWDLAARFPHLEFLGVIGGYNNQCGPRGPGDPKNPKDPGDPLTLTRRRELAEELPNVTIIEPVVDMAGLVYRRTRILLMPSERETYGRTAVEAACSGIPTIAHPTPGLVHTLGDAGTFVDRNDPDAWAATLEALLDHTTWGQASLRAIDLADRLTPAADLERFVTALERLAA